MKAIKSFGVILLISVSLAGCSFEDLFAQLATSDVEEGARQEYEQVKSQEAKRSKIESLTQTYPQAIELKNVADTTNYIAHVFRKAEGEKTSVAVEAILPNPGKNIYEVWARNNDTMKKVRIGTLSYVATDDYSLATEIDQNLTEYNSYLISRESTADDTIETIIMTGAF